MGIDLEDVADMAIQVAKQNLINFGYLEKVVLALTKTEFLTLNVRWENDEEKMEVLSNLVNHLRGKGCKLYVMVGEGWYRAIDLKEMGLNIKNELEEFKDGGRIDCILINGRKITGESLAVIVPFTSRMGRPSFLKPIWLRNSGCSGPVDGILQRVFLR